MLILPLVVCCNKPASDNKTIIYTEMKNVIPIDSTINVDTIQYPIVSKEFETFDFAAYEKRPPANPDLGGYRNSHYVQRLFNGIVIEMEVAGEGVGGGFYYEIYYPNALFHVFKHFYANGNIKEKGLYGQNFEKGIWYEFDDTGKLIKETNYDLPFQFTFEDIVQYCKKNEIKLGKGFPGMGGGGKEWYERQLIARIYRKAFEGACYWEIQYKKEDLTAPQGTVEITVRLDGKTGKVLSKTVEPVFFEK